MEEETAVCEIRKRQGACSDRWVMGGGGWSVVVWWSCTLTAGHRPERRGLARESQSGRASQGEFSIKETENQEINAILPNRGWRARKISTVITYWARGQ